MRANVKILAASPMQQPGTSLYGRVIQDQLRLQPCISFMYSCRTPTSVRDRWSRQSGDDSIVTHILVVRNNVNPCLSIRQDRARQNRLPWTARSQADKQNRRS